jgi:hypothetical protein
VIPPGGFGRLKKVHFSENALKALSRGLFLAEKGLQAVFRPKIRTWTSMPLKGHIVATFRGPFTDCSLPHWTLDIVLD